jgi:hypothetical protein
VAGTQNCKRSKPQELENPKVQNSEKRRHGCTGSQEVEDKSLVVQANKQKSRSSRSLFSVKSIHLTLVWRDKSLGLIFIAVK